MKYSNTAQAPLRLELLKSVCDLFVSKCSARVYGAGKQWAVCTHYSSKHTPIHTCGNVRAHMDFTSCPAIITQTVKNKTQTSEERAEQM